MSSISSMSGVNPSYTRPVSSTEGDYDANSKMFGPVAATAIGAAEAGGAGVSSVVSFSQEALQKVGDALESGYDAVKSGVNSVTTEISDLANEGVAAVKAGYNDVASAVSSAVDSVESAANSVGDTVSSAASTVGQYAAMGLAAGKQMISEVV